MASGSKDTFGFELLYTISKQDIKKNEDVLVLFVHWHLIKNGFKCLGCGDSKTISPNEEGSELLAEGWSQAPNYSLRYIKEGKLYILIGIKSDDDLILNFLKVENHAVSNVQFSVNVVKTLEGPLATLIPNYEEILNSLKNNLVEPVYTGSGIEVSTQTLESQSNRLRRDDDDPLRVGPPQRPAHDIPGHDRPGLPLADPFRIGQDDLNPLGQGGGGMIFDPFRRGPAPPFPGIGIPGRLPPGAVPPAARFDPFGPPDINPPNPRGRVPDADHMPPPGYDDMFM